MIDVNLWRARIQRAQALQANVHKEWKESLDLINCEYFQKRSTPLEERVDVHFANWYYNNLVPLTYFRDPFIFFKSKNDKFVSFAETLETAVNAMWGQLKLKQQFKRVIGSALIMPPGWIKVGYTAKIGQDVAKIEQTKQKSLIKSLKNAITGVFKEQKEDKLPEEQGVLNSYIKEESVFATWIPSWNILLPDGYHLISNAPYIIEWEDVPVVDFKANPQYKNKEDIRGTREMNTGGKDGGGETLRKVTFDEMSGASDKNDFEVIRLFHIWDRREQKRATISMRSDLPHFEGDWPYDMDGFPYKELIFEENLPSLDKSNPYPTNIIKPILPQIIEQSNARTQMAKWRKRSSAIIVAQRGMLTEDDMNQLEESEALQIVYVSNKDGIMMTQTPPLPNGVFEVDGLIKQDLQQATNMGQMMFAPPKGTRTATQAKIGEGGLQLKISAKQDSVEDLTVVVARSLAQLMWQFYDKEAIVELIGEDVSDEMWPKLPDDRMERRRVIQQMQIKIDAGSAAPPKDDTVDRKQTLDMVSILNAIMPERLNKGEVGKRILKKFKFSKEDDKMIYTNDEEEQKCAEEENGFLLANHPQIVSPNTNHELHIKVHAQAMAQGGNSAALHQHILDHAAFLKGGAPDKGGGGQPQEGDVRPPMQAAKPEMVRQGQTTGADIQGSVNNPGPGTSGAPRG